MTNQDYTKYTGLSYMTIYRNKKDAVRLCTNEHNLGKSKIVVLADGRFGVCQNSVANKFTKAGYSEYFIGFADIA